MRYVFLNRYNALSHNAFVKFTMR